MDHVKRIRCRARGEIGRTELPLRLLTLTPCGWKLNLNKTLLRPLWAFNISGAFKGSLVTGTKSRVAQREFPFGATIAAANRLTDAAAAVTASS